MRRPVDGIIIIPYHLIDEDMENSSPAPAWQGSRPPNERQRFLQL